MKIRIAGAQIPVTNDVEANVAAIGRAIAFATRHRAAVLLTPEGSLSGYTHRFDPAEVSDALTRVTAEAKARRVGLALGTCFLEPGDGRCYNQIRFYSPAGRYLGFHAKTLRCGTLAEPPTGEVCDFAGRPLRTFRLCGATVGGLICNDLWANPGCTPMPDTHLTQQLARMGARIVLHAVNGGRDASPWSQVYRSYHEANLRLRARAGRLWVVTVDNCEPPDLAVSCPGGVLRPDGEWATRVEPQGERMFAHTIELKGRRWP